MRYHLIILACFSILNVSAQTRPATPYFVVNSKHVDATSFMTIDPESIEKLSILKPEKAKKFGKYASKHGAVLIELTKDVKLISLPELLELYHIEANAMNLPLMLSYGFSYDKIPVESPKSFHVAISAIQSVGIQSENIKEKKCLLIIRKMMDEKPKSKFALEIASLYKLFYGISDFYYPKPDVIIIGK